MDEVIKFHPGLRFKGKKIGPLLNADVSTSVMLNRYISSPLINYLPTSLSGDL